MGSSGFISSSGQSPLQTQNHPSLPTAQPNRGVLRVVYFVPSDRQPEANFRERLDRVMTHVQQFYRQGMVDNGHGELSFELERDLEGGLQIYTVWGQKPMRHYHRQTYDNVRNEVKKALARQGIEADHETMIIFQLLLEWQQGQAREIGPYVGCGNAGSGTAWVYDDAKLDAQHLASCAAGGYYGQPCSLGEFNSHYIGGVAHELGHAFGLPHDCECSHDQHRGYSLMGCGNHSYGQEQRGEGNGTFLSAASALPLSVHPLFTGRTKPTTALVAHLTDCHLNDNAGDITLSGQLQADRTIVGVVVHNDPKAIPDDYNATGWVTTVDAQGRFQLQIGDFHPGGCELRLTAYAKQGECQMFTLPSSLSGGLGG
jgi:hypothetical protein